MSTRLSIGDFSQMTYLSIKALRRYHEMGLLVPAAVDRYSGFRYYEPDQVPLGQVIRRFRDLGMPLEQVKEVLRASDPASRNALIVAHLTHMEQALEQTQQAVASLRALLERPAQAAIHVEYRSVAVTPALAIAERVAADGFDGWWETAFGELRHAARSAGAIRTGPDSALYTSEFFQDEIGEVTAYIPVGAGGTPRTAGRVRLTRIPAAELAITVHRGAFSELDQAYGALGTFVAEREIGVTGPIREHYLVTSADTDDESRQETEVGWPVFHTKGDDT